MISVYSVSSDVAAAAGKRQPAVGHEAPDVIRIVEIFAVAGQQTDQGRHLSADRDEVLMLRKRADAAVSLQITAFRQAPEHARHRRPSDPEHRRKLVRPRNPLLLVRMPVDQIHDVVPDFDTLAQTGFRLLLLHVFSL